MIELLALVFACILALLMLGAPLLRLRQRTSDQAKVAVLVSARNNETELRQSLPVLLKEFDQVILHDAGSSDGTVQLAKELGVTFITGAADTPKQERVQHAYHHLGLVAREACAAEWWLFMPGDALGEHGIGRQAKAAVATHGTMIHVIHGVFAFRTRSPFLAVFGLALSPIYASIATLNMLIRTKIGVQSPVFAL